MKNGFTNNTLTEVDFFIDELKLPVGSAILDVGCGTGRHSVELANRGYQVTGVDISSGMLAEAKKAASEADVHVEWIQSDVVKFNSTKTYDAIICLCEGAFAFTATPKAKTLEKFGRTGEDGKPYAFHVYSMRQAIEEGFILDVLKN